ncbi:FG-GAP-like repeat-containing protein [Megalodesulfovibrio paquesii]
MRLLQRLAGLFILAMCGALFATAAQAAEKTFAVLPFSVNGPQQYQYLSKGLQDMLSSRLYWKDHARPMAQLPAELPAAKDMTPEKGRELLGRLRADYLIWGSVTVMGNDASIDLRAMDAKGGQWPQSGTVKLDNLIPSLEGIARKLSAEAFGRTSASGTAPASSSDAGKATEKVNAMNPALVHNQADQSKEFYLNPQFRYAGDSQSEGRLRSQSLAFASAGMIADDFDGDGKREIIIIDDTKVYAYHFDTDMTLKQIAVYEAPVSLSNLHVSAVDYNNDKRKEIIVSAVRTTKAGNHDKYEKYEPRSYVLSFDGSKLNLIKDNIKLYLNAINTPPRFEAKLYAQKPGRQKLFDKGIYEAIPSQNGFDLGSMLFAPDQANVFNLGYLPQPDGYKMLVVDKDDYILVFTDTGERQARTDKPYFGSFVGMFEDIMPEGFEDEVLMRDKYYIPMRMVPFNMDGDNRYELLVNRPISMAAQFFQRYRYFPQGEIHSLYWDGVGMNLVWKTRSIKGSVVDYGITDINNDGITDLYVLVNTHPGALGLNNRKSIVLVYPLDMSQSDRAIDQEFSGEPTSRLTE